MKEGPGVALCGLMPVRVHRRCFHKREKQR